MGLLVPVLKDGLAYVGVVYPGFGILYDGLTGCAVTMGNAGNDPVDPFEDVGIAVGTAP